MLNLNRKNTLVKAVRGSSELRRGGTIMLRQTNGVCVLCRAAELSDVNDMTKLSRLAQHHFWR